MARTARDNRPHIAPVQKIELNARHTKVRLALALLLLIFGAVMLCYALFFRGGVEAGWTEIAAETGNEPSCAGEFTFLYPLGTTAAPAAEQRALIALYSDACADAYRLFTGDAEFDGAPNLRTLNAHPNEEFALDPALYSALEAVTASGERSLYLAPIHEVCDGIFTCGDPALTADYDPRQNGALRAWCASVCAFASDPDQVNVELLGGNRAVLRVSDEYLAFAREQEIERFIDFSWLRNAFIADYLAERLTAAGYAMGTLSSRDGFMRNLDAAGETDYAVNLIDRDGDAVRAAAALRYRGARAIVALRSFPINSAEVERFAPLPGSGCATPYLDAADGLCRAAYSSLTAYSDVTGCAQIALRLAPVYIADAADDAALLALAGEGIHSVFPRNGVILHTEEPVDLASLAEGYSAALLTSEDKQ